jgi:hypothetical protein
MDALYLLGLLVLWAMGYALVKAIERLERAS